MSLTIELQEGQVVITRKEYDELLEDSRFLSALRCAGVDNCNAYEEAQRLIEEWDAEDDESEG